MICGKFFLCFALENLAAPYLGEGRLVPSPTSRGGSSKEKRDNDTQHKTLNHADGQGLEAGVVVAFEDVDACQGEIHHLVGVDAAHHVLLVGGDAWGWRAQMSCATSC